ncbi:MAG: deoxyguanosinetriphosphate triphosphohydrolase [Spirochaetales bacterium]
MESLFFQNPLSMEALKKRLRPRPKDSVDLRGIYFRDTTAIIHSYPFRRLKHKTQVFFAPKNDHICTRIKHVMHVSTIAATICRALSLDSDLAWAIGLGHDLGHTPFGHLGERILRSIIRETGLSFPEFHHELYSLRMVDHLANYGRGLNLSYAVRDGIATHCGEKYEQRIEPEFTIKDLSSLTGLERYPATWEGCVVRMADKVAYLGRDLEDALQLKIIHRNQIPEEAVRVLGDSNSEIIDTLVNDMILEANREGKIGFSDTVFEAVLTLKDFNYRTIYEGPVLSSYHDYFERILRTLHSYLLHIFTRYGEDFPAYRQENNRLAIRFGDYLAKMAPFYRERDKDFRYAVIDYIAGMTDDYAMECVQEIMIPRKFEYRFDEESLT